MIIDVSEKIKKSAVAHPAVSLPAEEKTVRVRRVKKGPLAWMQKSLRIACFLLLGLLLHSIILKTFKLLRFLNLIQYIFLVYPGSDRDLEGYCPPWLAKTWLFSRKPSFAGLISKGNGGRGLYLVVPNTAQDFTDNRETCEKVIARLDKIKKATGAKAIAIAGQVPGKIKQHGIELKEPFVSGNKGTVFCVMETVDEVCRKHELSAGNFKIAIVGVGYVGSLLYKALLAEGHDVTGIDIVRQKGHRGILLKEAGERFLSKADMTIVLTPRGSDFAPYVKHLKNGSIVIDDTHPKIRQKPDNIIFYKVAVFMPGVKFWPRLPGYANDWIPGCTVEGIYAAATGDFNGTSQKNFNEICRQLGFKAHLVN